MENKPPQPPAPPRPRPRRPAGSEGGPSRPGRTLPKASRESRFIGYLVLGFGVIAVLAVIILATGGRDTEEKKQEETAQTLAQEMIQPAPAPAQPVKPALFFERQPKIDAADMVGTWQAQIGRFTVVLQFQKGIYQIVMASDDPNAARRYSTGTYKMLEDIVLLTPRLDWPPPKASSSDVRYEVLTSAPFPMLSAIKGGDMLWQNPPESEKRVVRPYRSPLIGDAPLDYITWKRMD